MDEPTVHQAAADINTDPAASKSRPGGRSGGLLTRAMTGAMVLALVVGYALLAIGLIWPFSLRETAPWPSLLMHIAFMVQTFSFHGGVAFACLALRSLIARQARLAILALPGAAICLAPTAISYMPREARPVSQPTVKLMSANLLAFNRDTGPIVAEIVAENPDVLMLQEFTPHWQAAIDTAINDRYPHRVLMPQTDCFGLAIYSKRPFIGEPSTDVRLGREDSPQIRAVIDIGGRPVVFYDVHLVPPTTIAWSTEQRIELADLIERISRETDPVVVSGDFNLTPDSFHHAELRRAGFVDAHEIAGRGRGTSWPVKRWTRYVPGIRIDHIYLSRGLSAATSREGIGMGSDHRPVIADIGLATADTQATSATTKP